MASTSRPRGAFSLPYELSVYMMGVLIGQHVSVSSTGMQLVQMPSAGHVLAPAHETVARHSSSLDVDMQSMRNCQKLYCFGEGTCDTIWHTNSKPRCAPLYLVWSVAEYTMHVSSGKPYLCM